MCYLDLLTKESLNQSFKLVLSSGQLVSVTCTSGIYQERALLD